jgi:hypothetical protein
MCAARNELYTHLLFAKQRNRASNIARGWEQFIQVCYFEHRQ